MLRFKYNFNVKSWSQEADYLTDELAKKLGLELSIRENPAQVGEMIIEVEGLQESLESFESRYIRKLSKIVSVDNFIKTVLNPLNLQNFRESNSKKIEEIKDQTICEECIKESIKNQFYLTSCAKCEPIYSILEKLPFTRKNTVFNKLPECEDCHEKYYDKTNRLYKTESICCDIHNSLLKLSTKNKEISTTNAINSIVKLLKAGKVGLLKNINGYYIMGVATKSPTIEKIRKSINQDRKTLSILIKTSLQTSKFATLSKKEEALLNSNIKPIVRVRKREIHRLENVKHRILNSISYTKFYNIKLPKNALEILISYQLNIGLVFQKVDIKKIDESYVDFKAELDFDLGNIDDSFMQVVYGKNQIIKAGFALAPIVMTLPKNLDKKVLAKSGDSFAIGYENKMILAPSGESMDRFLKLFSIENPHMIKDENKPYLSMLNLHESGYENALIIENDRVFTYDGEFKEIYSFKKPLKELFDEVAIMSKEVGEISYEKESQLICESSYEICKEDIFEYKIANNTIEIEIDSSLSCQNIGSALINTISNIFIEIIKEYEEDVILSGEVFENKNLAENIIEYLDDEDREYYMSETTPINQTTKPLGMILDFCNNMC